jgi:hypothetical protein
MFADALASVTEGGTIVICDGTHNLTGAGVSKPVTVRPENAGKVTITNTGSQYAFFVSGFAAGTARITGFTFDVTGVAGVYVSGTYDKVIVESSTFRAQPNALSAVDVNVSGPGTDALVTVRANTAFGFRDAVVAHASARLDVLDNVIDASTVNGVFFRQDTRGVIQRNRITGGAQGIFLELAGVVEVLDNTISAQPSGASNASIDLRGLATVGGGAHVVRGNRLSQCPNTCIKSIDVNASIVENVIEGRVADLTRTAISVTGGRVTVSRNTIDSPDEVTDRSNVNAYAFPAYGIAISRGTTPTYQATVDSNSVRHAYVGILASDIPAVTGQDNVVTLTNTALQVLTAGPAVHRNDFTDYILAASGVGQPPGSLSCNYWGSASAPAVGVELQTAVQPHSQISIARKPHVVCP